MMNNRQIYTNDPSTWKLVNEGVAYVNDEHNEQALEVLRYELNTFVCDGQYEKGLEHIIETFLKNINEAQQPAVWVSGFYGSGKSHLVKMLRALWIDTEFPDGATARGIAKLPAGIQVLLKELSTAGKRHGGLHAASGTIGAGASGSVRLALLRLIFKSIGLPEQYHVARFVMWLRNEHILDAVIEEVEKNGRDWQEELDNFYVAEGLHAALVKVKPTLFPTQAACVETLNNLYPFVKDISSDEMLKAIRQALTKDDKFPLTLIVLDEIQQYIGEDSQRSIEVQELVESCCKGIGGKLLFIGTGQTAVTGTANLKRLEGRFTIRIELSDADVDSVVRQVVLAKKPEALGEIQKIMQINLGEVSRHLTGTSIGHRQDDIDTFARDYPILPIRRRFWEHTLRVLDQTGTESQLRNQLGMVYKVIQTNLDAPLGNVIPADALYFESAGKLQQAFILPKAVYEKTITWINGSPDEKLKARACGLVFLINKLNANNKEIGIHATLDTIADLMVDDLTAGSSALRSKLPGLLEQCELLMKVDNEYRLRTKESAAWNDDFQNQYSLLANEAQRVDAERADRIRRIFAELVKKLSLTQGNAKVIRELSPLFDSQLPPDASKRIYVWIRDGWGSDENSVLAEARQAGIHAPTIFVFIPKRSADAVRRQLIDYKAAVATLEKRGVPNTPEGNEARSAMDTIRQTAEAKLRELLNETFSGAQVFQGGGNRIHGNSLQEMILEAAENALQRLYPNYGSADHAGWDKVYAKAKQGAPDALKMVGDDGEPAKNPVCKAILAFIAGGKAGADIRNAFEAPPYGWSRDAVDGGLQVLLVAGAILAQDERGRAVDPKELERKAIGKAFFKVESTTISAPQRIQIRKVLQRLGIQAKQGEESAAVPEFLRLAGELAERAGGEAPRPDRPDTASLEAIRLTAGNDQLMAIFNQHDELKASIDAWEERAKGIEKRWPAWETLCRLLKHAGDLAVAQPTLKQAEAIKNQRLLLATPDPVQPLLKSLEDALRAELTAHLKQYTDELNGRISALEKDASWQQLTKDERDRIYAQCDIADASRLSLGTSKELLSALEQYPLAAWRDRIDALPGRFARARELAAKSLEPATQAIDVPRRTLKTNEDIDVWVDDVRQQLRAALPNGPIVIR